MLYGFVELEFDFVETTNVVPCNSGHLDNGFSERRGIRSTKGESELSMVTPRESRTLVSMVRSIRSIFSRICCMAALEHKEAISEPT